MDDLEKIMLDERFNCLSQRIEAMETCQKDMEDLISSVAVLAQLTVEELQQTTVAELKKE